MIKFLTEEILGEQLLLLLPENEFIHDKSVPGSTNVRLRPDYRCDKLMLIVEFDGYSHYNSAKRIKNDITKDADYVLMGYRIVRIPYFIQMSTGLIEYMLESTIEYEQTYPHGFIDSRALLPADYCELGVEKFKKDLDRFGFCREDIIESLKVKIDKLGDIDMVLPKSLQYLVN